MQNFTSLANNNEKSATISPYFHHIKKGLMQTQLRKHKHIFFTFFPILPSLNSKISDELKTNINIGTIYNLISLQDKRQQLMINDHYNQ